MLKFAKIWLLASGLVCSSFSAADIVSGRYLQEKWVPGLVEPLQSGGRFYFDSTQGMFWQEENQAVSFVQSKGRMSQWQNDAWQPSAGPAIQKIQKIINAILSDNTAALQKEFTIEEKTENQIQNTSLYPKKKSLARFVKKIQMLKGDFIQRIVIDDARGGSIVLNFFEPKTHQTLDVQFCSEWFFLPLDACAQKIHVSP